MDSSNLKEELEKLKAALKQIEEQCVWVDHCKCEPTDPCLIAHNALKSLVMHDSN